MKIQALGSQKSLPLSPPQAQAPDAPQAQETWDFTECEGDTQTLGHWATEVFRKQSGPSICKKTARNHLEHL